MQTKLKWIAWNKLFCLNAYIIRAVWLKMATYKCFQLSTILADVKKKRLI